MLKKNMRNIHPGEILREEVINSYGLTVKEAAGLLGISRQALSNVINEKADISPEMALRIAKVFGGTPDIWMRLQIKHDLQIAATKISHFRLVPYRPTGT